MSKYRVAVPFVVWVEVDVDAKDSDEAIDIAMEEAYLANYVGNGSYNNLLGNSIDGSSVKACEECLDINEGDIKLQPEIIKEYY